MEHPASPAGRNRLAALTIGAIGVVYGDIGTSPLYAFREALAQAAADGIDRSEVLGVLSLALWALIIVVTIKYVLFLTRADNNGEGGVLSLMALANRATASRWRIVLWLGAAGAALFYGDAIITPALSVLSAVEGIATVPGMGAAMTPHLTLGITIAILIGLFIIQSRGTAKVARLFGPVCILWFLVLAGLGIWHIVTEPQILLAFLPGYAIQYLATHGSAGLFTLGAVFLTVTGAEALIADMGHFGRRPIQIGWFAFVFPALTLNYLGQGALALHRMKLAAAAGQPFGNADWFFLMAPDSLRAPLVILATLATIIASQAVITGAFSITQQGIALGLLPRLTIRQTSADQIGQIYLPLVNWLLLPGVILLVLGFRTSSSMAAAYGIAVTGTMVITTCLAFFIVWQHWRWSIARAIAFIVPFLVVDCVFFGANILRVAEGGWVPLTVAAAMGVVIATWIAGRGALARVNEQLAVPVADLAAALLRRPPQIVDGLAVFLTQYPDSAPSALMHNLKHNKALHAENILLGVTTSHAPHVPPEQRLSLDRIDTHFSRGTMTYGYMDTIDLPTDLARNNALLATPGGTSFFVGRNAIKRGREPILPASMALLYGFLHRNAADPTAFFNIPANRVVELGSQIEL